MKEDIRLWSGAVAILSTLATAALVAFHPEGWLGALYFWPMLVIGAGAAIVFVLVRGSRWLLLAIPLLMFPLAMFGLLVAACSFGGDCL